MHILTTAHADKSELLKGLEGFKKSPRRLFVTHGEINVSKHFAGMIRDEFGWEVTLPDYRDEVILD